MTFLSALLVCAMVCFALATVGVNHPRINLLALGLFFATLATVVYLK